MSGFDPLEETQENLHPVVMAHRARDARPAGGASRRRLAAFAALLFGGALLVWLLLPVPV
jgi:hypothetical protein